MISAFKPHLTYHLDNASFCAAPPDDERPFMLVESGACAQLGMVDAARVAIIIMDYLAEHGHAFITPADCGNLESAIEVLQEYIRRQPPF